jgi:hypothetical protein
VCKRLDRSFFYATSSGSFTVVHRRGSRAQAGGAANTGEQIALPVSTLEIPSNDRQNVT